MKDTNTIWTDSHGEVRIRDSAPMHTGGLFDVWRGDAAGRSVAIKTPSTRGQSTLSLMEYARVWYSHTGPYHSHCGPWTEQNHARRVVEPWPLLRISSEMLKLEFDMLQTVGTSWNHNALTLGQWDDRPALVSDWIDGEPLTHQSPRLFSRMLVSLWDALSISRHGDLNLSNIIVHADQTRFSLIDPGISLVLPTTRHNFLAVLFTTASSYPIFEPSIHIDVNTDFDMIELASNKHVNRTDRLCSIYSEQDKHTIPPRGPGIADLHAMGLLYYRMLTARHPFPWFKTTPLWNHVRSGPGPSHSTERWSGDVQCEPGHYEPIPIWESWVSPAERALAMKLVRLEVRHRWQLEELVSAL